MESLIYLVKGSVLTKKWRNAKAGVFEYDQNNIWHQFAETTPDLKTYIVSRFEQNKENCPVIALGLTAYLLHNWGKPEQEIFTGFYNICKSHFVKLESIKPGSSNRDLESEFYA